jgi:hypothetical protein
MLSKHSIANPELNQVANGLLKLPVVQMWYRPAAVNLIPSLNSQGGTAVVKNPPLDYLLVCSGISLSEFLLSRMNQVANLRKQVQELQDALRESESEALLARWLMEHRHDLLANGRVKTMQPTFEFVECAEPRIEPRKAAGRKQLKEVVA